MATYQWRQIDNTVKMRKVCQLNDGTFLGVGASDGRLYTRANMATWEEVPSARSLLWISEYADGTLIGVGVDNALYTCDMLYGTWVKQQSPALLQAVKMNSGDGYLCVGTDNQLWTVANLHGATWVPIPDNTKVISAAALADGSFLAVGTDHLLYERARLNTPWAPVVNQGGLMLTVTGLMSGAILGVGTNHLMYTRSSLSAPWVVAPNGGANLLACSQRSDGSLLAIDLQHGLLHASELPSAWTQRSNQPNLGCVSQLMDGTFIGIGWDYDGYRSTSIDGTWQNAGPQMKNLYNSIQQLRDGTLLGSARSGKLYTQATIDSTPVAISGPSETVQDALQLPGGRYLLSTSNGGVLITSTSLQGPWTTIDPRSNIVLLSVLRDGTVVGTLPDGSTVASRLNWMVGAIDRVVVFMLENRGFDSLLGYLYSPSDPPAHVWPPPRPGRPPYNGVAFCDPKKLAQTAQLDLDRFTVEPTAGVDATDTPAMNPHEEFEHVNVQLFGSQSNPQHGAEAQMKGFLADYATRWDPRDSEQTKAAQLMSMYSPVDAPVLNTLARAYAVCDEWYSSVPTQTNANRAFSIAGTSLGLVDNGFLTSTYVDAKLDNDRFPTDTIFNVLSRNNVDWGVFWQIPYPPGLSMQPYTRNFFPFIDKYVTNAGQHFRSITDFFTMAEAGTLPPFTYVEPYWGGEVLNTIVNGNDYHPPADTSAGELFVQKLVSSLQSNPTAWDRTLLVLTFDEHGGTYDHQAPPWGAMPPWGLTGKPTFALDHDFEFDRFGVRVPTLVISPLVEAGTVSRSTINVPYDHTSIIATVLDWQQIDRRTWNLGARVGAAPTFDHLVTRTTPRTDNPFTPPRPAVGTPLSYGGSFYLQHSDGRYLTHALSSTLHYYARLATTGAVAHNFRLGYGGLVSGAKVQIFTTETLENPQIIASGAPSIALGAWNDSTESYYYATSYNASYQEEIWTILKVGGNAGDVIKYGDQVNFVNARSGEGLIAAANNYLSTTRGSGETWVVSPTGK